MYLILVLNFESSYRTKVERCSIKDILKKLPRKMNQKLRKYEDTGKMKHKMVRFKCLNTHHHAHQYLSYDSIYYKLHYNWFVHSFAQDNVCSIFFSLLISQPKRYLITIVRSLWSRWRICFPPALQNGTDTFFITLSFISLFNPWIFSIFFHSFFF